VAKDIGAGSADKRPDGTPYEPNTRFTYDPKTGKIGAYVVRDTEPWGPGSDPAQPQSSPAADYSNFLGVYGLPGDVQTKVAQIFGNTPDVSQATALAMAYVRGTTWYAQTYPGIQEGIARGVISNEADYRNYLNNVNTLTKQYLGRDVGANEIGDYLKQGYDVSRIGRIYQGGAIAKTSANDWNYTAGAFDANGPFTADEQTALGQEQAGIDTLLGQKVQRRLDLAKQRMSAVFGGSDATPSLSLANGRLAAPGLAGGTAPNDIAA
jgi:hypothetical protein